jgi:hypothetical protein
MPTILTLVFSRLMHNKTTKYIKVTILSLLLRYINLILSLLLRYINLFSLNYIVLSRIFVLVYWQAWYKIGCRIFGQTTTQVSHI